MINKLINIYKVNKGIINYLVFGVLSTVINLVTYFILTFSLLDANDALQLQIANIIAWVVAVIFAYVTNRKYVFESKNDNKIKEIISFLIARLVTLGADMLIMYLGVNVFKYNDKIIKLISQFIVIASNYVLSKLFVFNEKKQIKKN